MSIFTHRECENLIILRDLTEAFNISGSYIEVKASRDRKSSLLITISESIGMIIKMLSLGTKSYFYCRLSTKKGFRILTTVCPQGGILVVRLPCFKIFSW